MHVHIVFNLRMGWEHSWISKNFTEQKRTNESGKIRHPQSKIISQWTCTEILLYFWECFLACLPVFTSTIDFSLNHKHTLGNLQMISFLGTDIFFWLMKNCKNNNIKMAFYKIYTHTYTFILHFGSLFIYNF